jgi:glycosyltransferase involved in cell wall biosynthesis
VATFHGTDVTTIPVRENAPVVGWRGPSGHPYARVFERLDLGIAVSELIERRLRALGFSRPIAIVPAGVSLERLAFRARQPPDDHFRLLYLGRLVPDEGVDVLLDALPAVVRDVRQVRLDVIGGGPLAGALRRRAHRLGVADRVAFHGPILDRERVLEAMRAAHLMVAPSRTMPSGEAEGSPVTTKEAQAIGVPLVATDSGGTGETIPPEHRADLARPNDPDALAERILALLHDRGAREDRARVARAWMEERFDARMLAQRTRELYEEITG